MEDDDDVESALASTADQAEADAKQNEELKEDHALGELVDAEEFLAAEGVSMLEYERQMFFDLLHSDALVVCAK